jgi:hypothetical protein
MPTVRGGYAKSNRSGQLRTRRSHRLVWLHDCSCCPAVPALRFRPSVPPAPAGRMGCTRRAVRMCRPTRPCCSYVPAVCVSVPCRPSKRAVRPCRPAVPSVRAARTVAVVPSVPYPTVPSGSGGRGEPIDADQPKTAIPCPPVAVTPLQRHRVFTRHRDEVDGIRRPGPTALLLREAVAARSPPINARSCSHSRCGRYVTSQIRLHHRPHKASADIEAPTEVGWRRRRRLWWRGNAKAVPVGIGRHCEISRSVTSWEVMVATTRTPKLKALREILLSCNMMFSNVREKANHVSVNKMSAGRIESSLKLQTCWVDGKGNLVHIRNVASSARRAIFRPVGATACTNSAGWAGGGGRGTSRRAHAAMARSSAEAARACAARGGFRGSWPPLRWTSPWSSQKTASALQRDFPSTKLPEHSGTQACGRSWNQIR